MLMDPKKFLSDITIISIIDGNKSKYGFVIPNMEVYSYQNFTDPKVKDIRDQLQSLENNQCKQFVKAIQFSLNELLSKYSVNFNISAISMFGIQEYEYEDEWNNTQKLELTVNMGNPSNKNFTLEYKIVTYLVVVEFEESLTEIESDVANALLADLNSSIHIITMCNLYNISNVLYWINKYNEDIPKIFFDAISKVIFDIDSPNSLLKYYIDKCSKSVYEFEFSTFRNLREEVGEDKINILIEITGDLLESYRDKANNLNINPLITSAFSALRYTTTLLRFTGVNTECAEISWSTNLINAENPFANLDVEDRVGPKFFDLKTGEREYNQEEKDNFVINFMESIIETEENNI